MKPSFSGQIRIGIIGAGYWGPNLIRNFNNINTCKIHWVCDEKPGRLNYVKQKWPDIPLTDDYKNILNDPEVDAVVIATPVATHFELGMFALSAGKHVFIEKPLAKNSREAETLVNLADKKNLVLATGHIFVHHPAVSVMKEVIDKGQIGELCYADTSRINLSPPASTVNVIWDLAVHDMSILLYLWGKTPVSVRAAGKKFLNQKHIDTAFIDLDFEDGTVSHHHVSWMSPQKVRKFFISGTKGSLVFDDGATEHKLSLVDMGIDTRIGQNDDETKELFYKPGEVVYFELPDTEPLKVECECFLNSIRNGKRPKACGQSGLRVVQVLEAAQISLEKGGVAVSLKE